ncbi:hypothetical protein Tco_0091055 [Tanacetum coccineum]
MFRFEPLLQEGICYKISNFGVTENGGRIPLLPHGWKLSFYNTTIVTRIEQIDENVTGFINELFTLLLDTNEEYQENDAVGTCTWYSFRHSLWQLIQLVQGKRLDLIFWDIWAKKCNDYAENLETVGRIDLMLMLGKVKYRNNTPAVHNALFGTKLYINRQFPELISFRERVSMCISMRFPFEQYT